MKFLTTAILIAMLALSGMAYGACDNLNNPPGDAPIKITIDQHLKLGSFPRPDTGTKTVIIGSDGSRTLPPELNVGTNNPDVFNQATATVTGGAGCIFQITVNTITGSLSNVTLAADSGYSSLSSNSSGAKGTLNSSGTFKFTIGVSDIIDSNTATPVGGSFNVRVDYSD